MLVVQPLASCLTKVTSAVATSWFCPIVKEKVAFCEANPAQILTLKVRKLEGGTQRKPSNPLPPKKAKLEGKLRMTLAYLLRDETPNCKKTLIRSSFKISNAQAPWCTLRVDINELRCWVLVDKKATAFSQP